MPEEELTFFLEKETKKFYSGNNNSLKIIIIESLKQLNSEYEKYYNNDFEIEILNETLKEWFSYLSASVKLNNTNQYGEKTQRKDFAEVSQLLQDIQAENTTNDPIKISFSAPKNQQSMNIQKKFPL